MGGVKTLIPKVATVDEEKFHEDSIPTDTRPADEEKIRSSGGSRDDDEEFPSQEVIEEPVEEINSVPDG